MIDKNYWDELDLPDKWNKRERFNFIMAYIDSKFDSSDSQEEETPTPTPTPTPEPQESKGTLALYIHDKDNNKVTDAIVTLTDGTNTYTENTDEEGECSLSDVIYGDYTFTIEAEGFESYTDTYQMDSEDDFMEIILTKLIVVGDVKVTVTDGDNPIGNASVLITDTDFTGTTGSAGGCTIRDVPVGVYTIEASKDGYITSLEDLTVTEEETSITITLELDVDDEI